MGVRACGVVRLDRRAYYPWEEWKKQIENRSEKERKCNYRGKMRNILVLHNFCFTSLIIYLFTLQVSLLSEPRLLFPYTYKGGTLILFWYLMCATCCVRYITNFVPLIVSRNSWGVLLIWFYNEESKALRNYIICHCQLVSHEAHIHVWVISKLIFYLLIKHFQND